MTALLLIAPILIPLAMAGGYALAGWRPATAWAGAAAAAVLLADATALAVTVATREPVHTLAGLLRADALSAWLLLVMATVAALACWASPGYLAGPTSAGPTSAGPGPAAGLPGGAVPPNRARWYGILLHLFVAAMATAVLAANLGVLWVAVEATTIVTAFLVGHQRSRTALEAAWKYVVICSAAIAIAFLGTVLLYYSARDTGVGGTHALDFATLTGHAGELDPAVTRIAIGLAVVGFGAKAGLVPLHSWLPDAHSQAPAPVSALMSGVLLSVAFYAILRLKPIADGALGPGFMRTLLLVLALVTLAVAALLLLGQRDYKRMLAYSSMEHMGLVALGAAVGSRLAIAAVLLHIAGHGLAKTVAFLGSGHILHRHHSTDIADVRGLAGGAPLLAGAFGLAVLALLGLPPAAIFASELGIARAGAAEGLTPAVAVAFVLAFAAFAALATRTAQMLLGPSSALAAAPPEKAAPPPDAGPAPGRAGPAVAFDGGRLAGRDALPLVTGLVVVAGLGVTTWPLDSLLSAAASIVSAGSGG